MTAKLRSITVKDEDCRLIVKREIILEITFDSIQKSERHYAGFAFRFRKIKYIPIDKVVNDIDTLEKVKQIYEKQVYLMGKGSDVLSLGDTDKV
jgi:DNA ligase-1